MCVFTLFSSNLVAFMTVSRTRLPVDSLEQLAAHPTFEAGILKGMSYQNLLAVSRRAHIFQ